MWAANRHCQFMIPLNEIETLKAKQACYEGDKEEKPQAECMLGASELLPQLRLSGPGGGCRGMGTPPGRPNMKHFRVMCRQHHCTLVNA